MILRSTWSTTIARSFHSSARTASHIGKQPIPVPPSVTFDLPKLSISPELSMTSPDAKRLLVVKGPLGTQTLVLLPPVIISPPSTSNADFLVSVHDSTQKPHKRAWGLTRSLIHNAVVGVSEGYTVELRLVGVGYRAAVEPIPEIFRNLQAQIPVKPRPRAPGAPPLLDLPLPTDRLNIKLGFSHPVLVDIPSNISVSVPQPTRIVLKGIDKQALGNFAATIRSWRKPEPYRGKGIFIDDETIKLKEVRKK